MFSNTEGRESNDCSLTLKIAVQGPAGETVTWTGGPSHGCSSTLCKVAVRMQTDRPLRPLTSWQVALQSLVSTSSHDFETGSLKIYNFASLIHWRNDLLRRSSSCWLKVIGLLSTSYSAPSSLSSWSSMESGSYD
jgi:hypothetical protein